MFDQNSNLSPDLEWMLQSGQAGGSLIVETLVEECYRPVYRLAFSILDDPGLARSAVIKSFLLTLRSAHRYRSDTEVKIWLFRITLQACRSLLPGLWARRALRAAFAPHSAAGDTAPAPQTTEQADLWLAVDALSEKLRLPLVLQTVHGLPVQAIAQILGSSEEIVQARLEKAKDSLRKRLGLETAADEAFPGSLAQELAARWPYPEPSPEQLDGTRTEIENRRAAEGRPQAARFSLRKLALGGLALLLIAGIGAASYLLFPDEDEIKLIVGRQKDTQVVQVKITATPGAEQQPDQQPEAPPAVPEDSVQMLPGVPAGFLLDVPEALTEQTFFDPLDEWANSGPIVLSRVLAFWGEYIPLPGIARTLQPNPADENVMPYELVAYVEENTDLKAALRMAGDFSMLAHLVSAGFPVILEKGTGNGESVEWMGHYVIAAGYEQDRQETLTLLSSLTPAPVSTLSSFALKEAWQPFNYIYLVIYPPEKEADLLRILGSEARAEDNYLRALEKASEDMSESGLAGYFAWFNRGTSLTYLEDYRGAAEAYDRAMEIYAQIGAGQRPSRMLWYQSRPYWAYFYSGRYDDVIRLADETLAAAEDPVLEESFYWRALEESLRLNPNFSAGLDQLSRLQGGS